ncbi:MAG: TonB-dependent receptor [Xanthomonadales bacterium]|nr:TonB-dependent receptor [Xanthomonadales bacterium]
MNTSPHTLYQAMKLAVGGSSVAGFAFSTPLLAQDQDDGVELETINVTGSRLISQVDIEGAAPVTVLDRTDIERIGLNDLAEVIRQLPSITGSPLGTSTNNGGNGSSLVDIRGLGSIRTLVLVNGRRDISGGDLSVIPISIVERIEVLKEGASAIYGADAVSGVVNIITRQDFEGADLTVRYGRSFELVRNPAADEVGNPGLAGSDGDSKRVSFVFGSSQEKSSFVIGLEYNEQDPVFQGNVDSPQFQQALGLSDLDDFLAAGLGSVNRDIDGDGNLGLASGGSSRSLGGFFNTPDGIFTRDLTTGEIRPFDGCGDPAACGGDLYNFAPVNFIQTPFERTNLFVQGDYDLFDNVNAYVEARYSNRRSSQLLAPLPYDSRTNPAAPLPGGGFGVPASNVYNPFGQDLTDVRRRIAETGGRDFDNEINQIQLNTGLRGTFGELAPTWDWDVSWQWGRRARIDTDRGQFVGARLTNALGPSFFDDAGVARCGTPDAVIEGCVPLNLFGGVGTITQDQLDYVSSALNDRSTTKRQVLNASVSGDLIDLPAGPLATAFGYEFRKEEFTFTPDSGKATDAVTGSTGGPTNGEYDVDSLFIEVQIPILSGLPGVELLEIGGGFRYDDYSTIGDTGNFQGSIRWQPIKSVLIRGSYSEVFREPNVAELFASQSDNFPQVQDVCSTGVLGDNDAPNLYETLTPEQQARCQLTGVPEGGFFQTDTQVRSRVGGNPDLRPETGETYTIGIAWSPEFIPGFSLTADYWDVDLNDAITTIAAGNVVSQCVVEGNLDQCNNISRFNDGNVNAIVAANTNIGGESASGVDVAFNYSTNTAWGLFDSRLLVTYLDERESTVLNTVDAAGRFENRNGLSRGVYPEWKGNFNVDWSYANFGASINVDYLGSIDEFDTDALNALQPGQSEDSAFFQKVDAEWYVDLVARYNFSWGTQISAGVTNVFDNDAPFIIGEFNANTDTDTYRLLGRSWFAQMRHSF